MRPGDTTPQGQLKDATQERLIQLFHEHGTGIMLFQANDILKREGLKAPKSRFYYVKKRMMRATRLDSDESATRG